VTVVKRTRRPWAHAAKPSAQARCARAGAAVADQQHVLALVQVLAAGHLAHQWLIEGGQGGEIEAVQGFHHRKAGFLDAPFGRFALPVQQLAFGEAQQVGRVVRTILGGRGGDGGVLPQHGGQLELLEVVLQQHRGGGGLAHRAPPAASSAP
jgi:hypothetical protein